MSQNIYLDIDMLLPPTTRRMLAQPQPSSEPKPDHAIQLQIARVSAGASRQALARQSKVPLERIVRYETGEERMDGVTLKVLKSALLQREVGA